MQTLQEKVAAALGLYDSSKANSAVSAVAFEYAVVQYSYDSATGEQLNIGVVLYCRARRFLGVRVLDATGRLRSAFPAFDTDQHRRVVARLEAALDRQAQTFAPDTLELFDAPDSLQALLQQIWRDPDSSYRMSAVRAGVTDNPTETLDGLYFRFVESQVERRVRTRRDDDALWRATYRSALQRKRVTEHLEPHTFKVDDFEYPFPYTFKNGSYHILEPVSLDYENTASLRERLSKLLGEARMLTNTEEPPKLYFLLGKPQDAQITPAYRSAVRSLRRNLGSVCRIVEEEQAEAFGEEIAETMRHSGILPVETA